MGGDVVLISADGLRLSGYRAEAQGERRGALLLVQEIFGVNGHIRAVCDRYAADGYTVIAPALFDRAEPGVELGYGPEDTAKGRAIRSSLTPDSTLLDVAAGIEALAGAGKIGILGYCWGGTLAWLAAARFRSLACAVCYYGGGIADALGERPLCPVMAHFGELDSMIPLEQVERLEAAHPQVQVFLYPAGHGFDCDRRPSYHPAAASLARERTLEFLRRHLG